MKKFFTLIAMCLIMFSCKDGNSKNQKSEDIQSEQTQSSVETKDEIPQYELNFIKEINKDSDSFTQGLFIDNGDLYESTGQHGESTLRKVNLKTGEVLKKVSLTGEYFGEGSAIHKNKIYWITWQNGECFVYDKSTFKQVGKFRYAGEGWGLTNSNDSNLVQSDGSGFLRIVNPENFTVIKSIQVLDGFSPIHYINELENINGEIWANIWQTDKIISIDINTGAILQTFDMAFLRNKLTNDPNAEALNGIAYDKETKKVYITGKYWNKYFEFELIKK